MISPNKMVAEFHTAFNHPINDQYPAEDPLLLKLRVDLIDEEVKEFAEAASVGDSVGMLDALADIKYVVVGASLCFGMELTDDLPDLMTIPAPAQLPDAMQGACNGHARALGRRASVLYSAMANGDLMGIYLNLEALDAQVVDTAAALGLPLRDAFVEVHRSNMAKLVDGKAEYWPSGKVKKPEKWVEPNLGAVLENARVAYLDAA